MQSPSSVPDAATSALRKPHLWEALLPVVTMAILLGVGYGVYRLRIEILLICASAVSGLVALRLGYSWRELQSGVIDAIAKAMPAMLILITVGMIIGSWLASGSIPMLIYYGLELISPSWFLLTACLVCSAVSLLTGTSYGTAGTLGIAFIGIAQGMDVPLGMAAGAVVAGAYFGDKISPFSDSTNLAAAAVRCNLFDHIPHLLWTTVPAYVVGLVVYAVAGASLDTSVVSISKIESIQVMLRQEFAFHWLLLLPPVVILYLTFRKRPPVPGMILSSLLALVLGAWFQGMTVKECFDVCVFGYKASTGMAEVDTLLSRGGMQSMMDVTLIGFCSFAFAGIMQKAGMLGVILERIVTFARTTGRLVASTVGSTMLTAMITGNSYLSVLIPGELFAPAYKARGLAAKNLSRTTEDSGTVVVPLIPWSIAGVYMAGTLGVPTLEYAGWAVMCYVGFLVALFYGFTGIAIAPKMRDDETLPGS